MEDPEIGDPTLVQREKLCRKITSLDVPKNTPEQLLKKIDLGEPLGRADLKRLACELASLRLPEMQAIVAKAWSEYVSRHPHLSKLLSEIKSADYNPLLASPVKVMVVPSMASLAAAGFDNSYITQPVSEAVMSQHAVTQLLSPDFAPLNPTPHTRDTGGDQVIEVWAHEGSHTALNPVFKKIADRANNIERDLNPNHFSLGDHIGKHGATSCLQEVAVRLAASELVGTPISSLPDVLLNGGYVTILPDLRFRAQNLHDQDIRNKGTARDPDEYTWDLWYDHPLREEVRIMCRTFIESRAKGYDPLQLANEVNKVILICLEHNPGVRHSTTTFALITEITENLIRLGIVKPTLPPIDIPLDNPVEAIRIFTPQHTELQNLIAKNWADTKKQ